MANQTWQFREFPAPDGEQAAVDFLIDPLRQGRGEASATLRNDGTAGLLWLEPGSLGEGAEQTWQFREFPAPDGEQAAVDFLIDPLRQGRGEASATLRNDGTAGLLWLEPGSLGEGAEQTWQFREFPAPDGEQAAVDFLIDPLRQGRGEASATLRNDGTAGLLWLEPGSLGEGAEQTWQFREFPAPDGEQAAVDFLIDPLRQGRGEASATLRNDGTAGLLWLEPGSLGEGAEQTWQFREFPAPDGEQAAVDFLIDPLRQGRGEASATLRNDGTAGLLWLEPGSLGEGAEQTWQFREFPAPDGEQAAVDFLIDPLRQGRGEASATLRNDGTAGLLWLEPGSLGEGAEQTWQFREFPAPDGEQAAVDFLIDPLRQGRGEASATLRNDGTAGLLWLEPGSLGEGAEQTWQFREFPAPDGEQAAVDFLIDPLRQGRGEASATLRNDGTAGLLWLEPGSLGEGAEQTWQFREFPAPDGEQAAVDFLIDPLRQGRGEASATLRNDGTAGLLWLEPGSLGEGAEQTWQFREFPAPDGEQAAVDFLIDPLRQGRGEASATLRNDGTAGLLWLEPGSLGEGAEQTWQFREFPAPDGEQAAVDFLNEPLRQGRGEASATLRNDGTAGLLWLEPGSLGEGAEQTWQFREFPAPDGEQAAVAFLNEPLRQGRGEASATLRNDGTAGLLWLEPGSLGEGAEQTWQFREFPGPDG